MDGKITRGQFLAALGGFAAGIVSMQFESGKRILTTLTKGTKGLVGAAATPLTSFVETTNDTSVIYHALMDGVRTKLTAIKPGTSIRVEDWRDKTTWHLELVDGTTDQELRAMQHVIDTFDTSALDENDLRPLPSLEV